MKREYLDELTLMPINVMPKKEHSTQPGNGKMKSKRQLIKLADVPSGNTISA